MKLLNLKTKSKRNCEKETLLEKSENSLKKLKMIDIIKHSNYEILKGADEILALINYIKQNHKKINLQHVIQSNVSGNILGNIKTENLESDVLHDKEENKQDNMKQFSLFNIKEQNEIVNLNGCDLNFLEAKQVKITETKQIKEEEIYKNIFAPLQITSRDFDDSDEELQMNRINNYPANVFNFTQKQTPKKDKQANSIASIQTNINKIPNKNLPGIFPHFIIDDIRNIISDLKGLNSFSNFRAEIKEIVNTYYTGYRDCKANRRKYLMFNPAFKTKCMTMAGKLGIRVVAERMKVPAKSLKRWMVMGSERKKGGGRKIKDPLMEEKLCAWYYHNKIENKLVTSKIIKQKALEFSNCRHFIASKGWFEKFKKKYMIEISKNIKQKY